MAVKQGTKDIKKPYQVVKSTGDVRKIRCQGCGNMAVRTPDGKGGSIWKCFSCGATFSFASM